MAEINTPFVWVKYTTTDYERLREMAEKQFNTNDRAVERYRKGKRANDPKYSFTTYIRKTMPVELAIIPSDN